MAGSPDWRRAGVCRAAAGVGADRAVDGRSGGVCECPGEAGLPELRLEGLGEAAAGALLASRAPARAPRLPRLALLIATSALLVFSLLPVSADAGSAGASRAKPTIVLVHGAWADGSSWNEVTRLLQRAGYLVLVPPNPLRSLSGDAAYISAFIQQRTSGPRGPGRALLRRGGHHQRRSDRPGREGAGVHQRLRARPRRERAATGERAARLGAFRRPHDQVRLRGLPWCAVRRLRPVRQAGRVPPCIRQRPARRDRRGAGRIPTTHYLERSPRTLRASRVEDHPELVSGRPCRQRHPARGTTRDGDAG